MKKKRIFNRNIVPNIINASNTTLRKGKYGIIARQNYLITREQIECCRVLIRRELKKKGLLFIRPVFTIPLTKKATGVRMGKGKGPIKVYKAKVPAESCIFEFNTKKMRTALKILRKISYKLPFDITLYSSITNMAYQVKLQNP